LKEIRQKIEALKGEIAAVDLAEYSVDEVSSETLADMKSKPEAKNLTSAYQVSRRGPIVKTGVSMSEHVDTAIAQMEK